VTVRFAALPPTIFKVRLGIRNVLTITSFFPRDVVTQSLSKFPRIAETFVLAVSNRELKYNMVPLPYLVVSSLHYIIIHLITLISHF
jgi:hypothetical protein